MTNNTMGNQQPSLSDFDLGWLCGLIDGEGCIGLWSRGGARASEVKAGVRVASTDKPTIEKLCEIYNKLEVTYHITYNKGKESKNTRGNWVVSIEGHKRVLKLLPLIKDRLICKTEQAKLVYEFSNRRDNKWHRSPYDEVELIMIDIAKGFNKVGYREEGSTTILNGVGPKKARSAQPVEIQ